jgi:hypothetical protein
MDVFVHEGRQLLLQVFDLVGIFEVHCMTPFSLWRFSNACDLVAGLRRRKTEQTEITEYTEPAIMELRLFRYFRLFRFSSSSRLRIGSHAFENSCKCDRRLSSPARR